MIDGLFIDLDAGIVRLRGQFVKLTEYEFKTLALLACHQGDVVSKEKIMAYLYRRKKAPKKNIVHMYVWNIRRKLGKVSGGETFIETIWGSGYRLKK